MGERAGGFFVVYNTVKTAMPEIEQSMKTMKVNTWFRKIYLPGE